MVSPRALSWDHSYSLYTTPLSSVISRHNNCHHLYADDTQIYLSLSKTDPDMSLSLVQQCLQDVSDWMIASKLELNPAKTEFILIGTKSQRDKFKKYFPTKLLDQDVTPTDSARNLGVEFERISILRNIYQKSVDHATIIYVIWSLAQMFNSSSD